MTIVIAYESQGLYVVKRCAIETSVGLLRIQQFQLKFIIEEKKYCCVAAFVPKSMYSRMSCTKRGHIFCIIWISSFCFYHYYYYYLLFQSQSCDSEKEINPFWIAFDTEQNGNDLLLSFLWPKCKHWEKERFHNKPKFKKYIMYFSGSLLDHKIMGMMCEWFTK